MSDAFTSVARHYGISDIGKRVLDALSAEGVDIDNLTVEKLAAVDQFHTRGLAATRDQLDLVTPTADMRVLDVGCGVGGPARHLAANFGCHVTGIDLTQEFIDVARMLTTRCRLEHLVEFRQANALDLPFPDGTFDLVWCQNVSMNIPDKSRFYGEIFRVLRPGGKFTSTEMAAGTAGEPIYPLPWARDPSINFVGTQDELRSALEGAGLRVLDWRDTTGNVVAVTGQGAEKARMSRLGVALVAGDDFPMRSANAAKSLAEGRLSNIVIAAERPA